uniref:Uncharacterized protein n=1 Tax=Glossina morsitans morsitans TaxID=37546 RepID=A0A1B0FNQ6_GLOMM
MNGAGGDGDGGGGGGGGGGGVKTIYDFTFTMLTDMTPTAGQLYGSQIPTMGMNITNIATHLQKPAVNPVSDWHLYQKYLNLFS